MQRDGLVLRRRDPGDGHSSLCTPTLETRDKGADVIGSTMAINEKALAPLTPDERRLQIDMLSRIVAALGGDDS